MNERVCECIKVSKYFGKPEQKTIGVIDLDIMANAGELLLIMGPSGSGKTTILTLLGGLQRPSSGAVMFLGTDMHKYKPKELQDLRAKKISFVFQNFHLIDSLTAMENIELALKFAGVAKGKRRKESIELLMSLNLEYLIRKKPYEMSHGEQQRVAICRAIANHPKLILADEPTASLDSSQGFEIIGLLHTLAKNGNRTVIVASHDPRLLDCADRVVRLQDGRITNNG